MAEFKITAPGLEKLSNALRDKGLNLRETQKALEKIAELAIPKWQVKANNPKDKGATWLGRQYADGITLIKKEFTSRSLSVTIGPVGKAVGMAKVVEEGRERFDMKPSLLASQRARPGKNGPYTIIGFRHGMATLKKAGVRDEFDSLKTMKKISNKIELNAFGKAVERNIYNFSSAGLAKKLGSVTSNANLSGAVKFQQPTGKDRSQGRSESQAITFRIVSGRSTGWFFPRIQAQAISKEVLDGIKTTGSDQLKTAIKADILAYLSGMKL